jgi:hypothetical protein
MAMKKVREFLKKHKYEAYAQLKEPGHVFTHFPEKVQSPFKHEQKIDFIIEENGLAFVIEECDNTEDGFVEVSSFAIRSVIYSKVCANCKAWKYNNLLFHFLDSSGKNVSEEEFYELMLPWELTQEDMDKDEGFKFLLSQAMLNNFDPIFDSLAERNGYVNDYSIVKRLLTSERLVEDE